MSTRWWQAFVLALGFVSFVGFGFAFRRAVNARDAFQTGAEVCDGKQDLAQALRGLSQRTHRVLAAAPSDDGGGPSRASDHAPSPVESVWRPLEEWASRISQVEPALLEFVRHPTRDRIAALLDASDSGGRACVSGFNGETDSATVAAALQGLKAPGFSLLAARASAARGCQTMFAIVTEVALDGDGQLGSARKVAALLADLAAPGAPQERMRQLRALHRELSSDSGLLSAPLEVGGEQRWALDPSGLIRVRQRLPKSELAALDCLPQTGAQLRRRLASLHENELAATGLFLRGEDGWQLSPEIERMAAVLDAFSQLEFVKRASPEYCDIEASLTMSRWDSGALKRFRAILGEYLKGGHLLRLKAAAREPRAAEYREFWSALPDAACGKIVQNLCVELNDALVPLPMTQLPELTRLRIQADSLVAADPIWAQIRGYARQFGCSEGGFGLAESDRYAASLLRGANDAIERLKAEITDRVGATVAASNGAESPLDGKLIEEELRRVRLEVSALALGIVGPALAHLSRSNSGMSVPSDWVAILDDLALPVAGKRGGAMASDGQSGLFAYERLYGEALMRAPHTCSMPIDAWSNSVFVKAGMFHGFGRELSSAIARRCASNVPPSQG